MEEFRLQFTSLASLGNFIRESDVFYVCAFFFGLCILQIVYVFDKGGGGVQ